MTVAEIQRIQISKLDAAQRQLRTSIKLWFYGEDPVSAHTLAYAAYTIIDDVTKARNPNRPGLLFDSPHLTPDDRNLFDKVYRGSGNFFKHANRDPNDTLNFSPNIIKAFFNFAILCLEAEGEQLSHEVLVFQAWSVFNNPKLRSKEGSSVFTDAFLAKYSAEVLAMSKHEFFDFYTEVLSAVITMRSQFHSDSSEPTTVVSDAP